VLRFSDYPCDFACDRIHSGGGKLAVACEHTLDQFGIFRCADQKQNVSRMIDEWKCEGQAPRIQFGNEICHDARSISSNAAVSGKSDAV